MVVPHESIGLDRSVNNVNIEDVSSPLSNALPNRVVPHPVRDKAVLALANHGRPKSLVASDLHASWTAKVLKSWGSAHPASHAENTG